MDIRRTQLPKPVPAVPSSPRPRRTQAERAQATQKKLIDSAIEVLKRRRYAGFRTAEVAELAGVSKGAQTHHFPSKDRVVLEALEEVYRQTQARALQRIERARQSPDEIVTLLMEDSREFFLGDDFLLSLDLMMVDPASALGVSVKRLAQQYRLPVEQAWVDALSDAGFARAQADAVVRLTFALARGFGIRKLIEPSDDEVSQLLATWHQMTDAMLNQRAPRGGDGQRALLVDDPDAGGRQPGGQHDADVDAVDLRQHGL